MWCRRNLRGLIKQEFIRLLPNNKILLEKKDIQFLKEEHSSIIRKLHEADAQDYQTKKGLV